MSQFETEYTNITVGPVIGKEEDKKKQVTVALTKLNYAHSWYEVLIFAKVEINDNWLATTIPDLWSNNSSIGFATASRVPDTPPRTDMGAFSVNDYGHVYLYFEGLPLSRHNGDKFNYTFTETRRPDITPTSLFYEAKFQNVSRDDDLMFAIHSMNSVGPSKFASYLHVPAAYKRCPMPTEIKKIKLDSQTYNFSWQPPVGATSHDCPEILSYTVFWCKSINDSPNSCGDYVSFERVSRDVRHFERISNETLNFAVAANSYNSSSGMIWTECTALAGNDLSKLTSIHVSQLNETSIEFRWELQCVAQSIIKGYVLHYCPVDDEHADCKEAPRQMEIDKQKKDFILNGLLPYTKYKTQIQMISDNSSGPLSDPIVTRTLEAEPSPPQYLRYANVTNTTVVLTWDPPARANGKLAQYRIYYNEREKIVDGNSTKVSIEGLKSFLEYDVLIKACTIRNLIPLCSNASNAIKFNTAVGVPSTIYQPNKISLDGRNIVRWNEPEVRAGPLQFYELRIQIKMMHDTDMHEQIIRINGTQCTLAIAVCQTEELHFSVRGVNVINSVHGDQTIIRQHIRRRDVHKRHSNPEISIDSRHSNYNHQESGHSHMHTLDIRENPEFQTICHEQHDVQLGRYLRADKHAMMLTGHWSQQFQFACNHEASGGFYFMLVFLAIITAALVYAAVIARRKLQKMKDIGVELPAGLENIKEENKGKNLEVGINTRDIINQEVDLIYSSEQEQSLLRSRMESASSNSTEVNSQCEYNEVVDSSEYEQTAEEDSSHSLSEAVDVEKVNTSTHTRV